MCQKKHDREVATGGKALVLVVRIADPSSERLIGGQNRCWVGIPWNTGIWRGRMRFLLLGELPSDRPTSA